MEVNPKQAIHVVAASEDLQKRPIGALLRSGPSLATCFPPVCQTADIPTRISSWSFEVHHGTWK